MANVYQTTPDFYAEPRKSADVPIDEGALGTLPQDGERSLSSRTGSGGNGPAETAEAIKAGVADPVTGNAKPDVWGRDASMSYPTEPVHSDHVIRWDVAAGRLNPDGSEVGKHEEK